MGIIKTIFRFRFGLIRFRKDFSVCIFIKGMSHTEKSCNRNALLLPILLLLCTNFLCGNDRRDILNSVTCSKFADNLYPFDTKVTFVHCFFSTGQCTVLVGSISAWLYKIFCLKFPKMPLK